ncbi:hypothetical protein [Salipiger sp. IMCC34102]|uniref:hypothetical protein n=1 Tax=Salipiger sp. IMCC34102 TaxID=2510647 RepID=UPI0013ED1247|nr:hypothetical protein [Salipiger sp. IMCC34102]
MHDDLGVDQQWSVTWESLPIHYRESVANLCRREIKAGSLLLAPHTYLLANFGGCLFNRTMLLGHFGFSGVGSRSRKFGGLSLFALKLNHERGFST